MVSSFRLDLVWCIISCVPLYQDTYNFCISFSSTEEEVAPDEDDGEDEEDNSDDDGECMNRASSYYK